MKKKALEVKSTHYGYNLLNYSFRPTGWYEFTLL